MPETATVPEDVASPETVTLADCSPAQQAEEIYIKVVNALVDKAVECGNVPILADVLAWTLARVIVNYGTPAAGDILRSLGGHVCELAARERARSEAGGARGGAPTPLAAGRLINPSPI